MGGYLSASPKDPHDEVIRSHSFSRWIVFDLYDSFGAREQSLPYRAIAVSKTSSPSSVLKYTVTSFLATGQF